MTFILRYFTEFGNIGGQLHQKWLKMDYNVCNRTVVQEIQF